MIFELDPVFSIFQRNGDHGSGYRIRLDRLAVSPGHPAVSPGHQKAEAVSSPSFQAAGDMSVLHFYVGDFSGLDPLRCLLEFLQIQTVKLVIFKSQALLGPENHCPDIGISTAVDSVLFLPVIGFRGSLQIQHLLLSQAQFLFLRALFLPRQIRSVFIQPLVVLARKIRSVFIQPLVVLPRQIRSFFIQPLVVLPRKVSVCFRFR